MSHLTPSNRKDDDNNADVDGDDGEDAGGGGNVTMGMITMFQALHWFFLYRTSFHLHCNLLKTWSLTPTITE